MLWAIREIVGGLNVTLCSNGYGRNYFYLSFFKGTQTRARFPCAGENVVFLQWQFQINKQIDISHYSTGSRMKTSYIMVFSLNVQNVNESLTFNVNYFETFHCTK